MANAILRPTGTRSYQTATLPQSRSGRRAPTGDCVATDWTTAAPAATDGAITTTKPLFLKQNSTAFAICFSRCQKDETETADDAAAHAVATTCRLMLAVAASAEMCCSRAAAEVEAFPSPETVVISVYSA